jgi:hypothetical protein
MVTFMSVAINRAQEKFDLLTEHQLAHGLLWPADRMLCLRSGASIKASRTLICCLAAVSTLIVSPSVPEAGHLRQTILTPLGGNTPTTHPGQPIALETPSWAYCTI